MDAIGSRLSSIRIAQILLYINAVIWLVLGIFTLLRLSQYYPESIFAVWIITILMVGNAGMMLLCGWGLGTGHRLFYYLALTVLAVNIILTFTDQFGLLDFLTLLIDLTILALLIAGRQRFFHTHIAE
jgi:hypothetical protein